jgi:hypothetical protein
MFGTVYIVKVNSSLSNTVMSVYGEINKSVDNR